MRAPKRTQREEKLRAWGLSLAVHLVLFLLLGASGFFLLMQAKPAAQEEDIVDIALLDSDAGGGDGGSAPAGPPAGAASAAPVVALPPAAKLPEIAETYTKEPQMQQAYRQQHQAAEQDKATKPAVTPNPAAHGDATVVGTAGGRMDGTGSGQGSGSGEGTSGSGAGQGTGRGSGNGSGQAGEDGAQASAAPVDAAAYCTYRATPAYPPAMIQAGAQGSVTVLITVSPASAVTDVSVIQSSGHAALDAAAVAAGWACRFQMNGHPGRYRTTYRFELRGSDDW